MTRPTVFIQSACVAVAVGAGGFSPVLFALSLGGEQVQSTLGQPLRLAIPLLGSSAESLETRCFRIVAPLRSDGLPVISQARIELQTNVNPPILLIRGTRAVDDPVIRIGIEASCDAQIRRDYTLLLDPPSLQPTESTVAQRPAAALAVTPPQAHRAQEATLQPPVSSSSGALTGGANPSATRSERAASKAKPSSRKSGESRKPAAASSAREMASLKAAERKEIGPDRLQVQTSQRSDLGSSAAIEDASLAALAVPRLRVSSDLAIADPVNQPPRLVTDELQAAISKDRRARLLAAPLEQDLAPRLEADLVVAQRRLAELQAQLSAAGLTAAASSAAASPATTADGKSQKSAVASATASQGGFRWSNWLNWLWIPGLILVLGLLGFLWRQRSRTKTAEFATVAPLSDASMADEEITVVMPTQRATAGEVQREPMTSAFAPDVPAPTAVTSLSAPAVVAKKPDSPPPNRAGTATSARAEREASDRLNNPLFQLRDTESHVDVTELSQVTDEAQVYADLGRNDQAIELLRDHIDYQAGERSSPAPWLMIFELYRRTNNRVGYDELAPLFRKHFNGRVPDWDNYGHELALDDGLEAFPHLVARIERDWGTADARKFLEELLYDNRGGSRLGFSLAAYRDILLLLQVHEGLNAQAEGDDIYAATDWESRGANDSDGTPKWDLSLDMIEPPKTGELESFLNRPPADKT